MDQTMWGIDSFYGIGKDIGGKLVGMLRRAITADVTYLKYEQTDNEPGSSWVVLTPHPWRYLAKLELTNATDSVAFVKRMTLKLGDAEPLTWSKSQPIRLEPAEPKEVGVIFPVGKDHKPMCEGNFVLEITPSRGRATRIKGRIPIG